ncbi:MAG: carboxyltransferase domain-containing protein [Devosia nanyangense]|uniref:Carboxyltransferase domain-containing protein n=1 Tax=Devosia nanyangense TaxID=1228055 RepID=A0A933L0D9_9HYPH|nr:carboxyltransferase domain-containing protein [Devosia nanyangense]
MAEGDPRATLLPLGDQSLLVKFADSLSEAANRAAIGLARRLERERPDGVAEIVPGLVSVLLRTTPGVDLARLRGELMLAVGGEADLPPPAARTVAITFDGEDLPEVAERLGIAPDEFVAHHNATSLRVLATGFAPGFVYCGFHPDDLVVPRREALRPMVPAGTILFAAGQTAIAATPIRTGWHVIGRTAFQNFDPAAIPPTTLRPGDDIRFTVAR